MTLRVRLAITLALVAVATAAAVAIATPVVVGRGFSQLDLTGVTPGHGQGAGPMAGMHNAQVQSDTVMTLVLVAIGAALVATLIGLVVAGVLTRPLGRLGAAAGRIAGGDLSARSGLASRTDELGALGRTFDVMADQLQRSEHARRRLFQDVAHELKTPLSVIDATSSAVLDGVYPHDDRHVGTIRDQARLLSRIVDDLRTVSLAESGDLVLSRSRVVAADLLGEVAAAFGARSDAAETRIRISAEQGLVVDADGDRLRQALGALVDNALRVAPVGTELDLGAEHAAPGMVELTVRDRGPGIAPEDLPHLFDRFYQADPARDRSSGTSGLGLAIVQAIARAHGGDVIAENAEGGGARFRLLLPALPSAA
jgi:signal transduction histidine kinase